MNEYECGDCGHLMEYAFHPEVCDRCGSEWVEQILWIREYDDEA